MNYNQYCTWNNTEEGNGCLRRDGEECKKSCIPTINGVQSQVTLDDDGGIQMYFCHCHCECLDSKVTEPNEAVAEAFGDLSFYLKHTNLPSKDADLDSKFRPPACDTPFGELTAHHNKIIKELIDKISTEMKKYYELYNNNKETPYNPYNPPEYCFTLDAIEESINVMKKTLLIAAESARVAHMEWVPPPSSQWKNTLFYSSICLGVGVIYLAGRWFLEPPYIPITKKST